MVEQINRSRVNGSGKKRPSEGLALQPDSVPSRLRNPGGPLDTYVFRPLTREDVVGSTAAAVEQDAFPDVVRTTPHDLETQHMIGVPTLGAFTKKGKMVGTAQFFLGLEEGKPMLHSHMTSVREKHRNGGIGEALKWYMRQVALSNSIDVGSWTYDPMQGYLTQVNLNKLGSTVGGPDGGTFVPDCYGDFTSAQNRGTKNTTDRYFPRWRLSSDWVQAHLEEAVSLFTPEEVTGFPQAIDVQQTVLPDGESYPLPRRVNQHLRAPYITVASPYNWNGLLGSDAATNDTVAAWRGAHREALGHYLNKEGYTVFMQRTDRERGVNLQVLARNFNSNNPPQELLAA